MAGARGADKMEWRGKQGCKEQRGFRAGSPLKDLDFYSQMASLWRVLCGEQCSVLGFERNVQQSAGTQLLWEWEDKEDCGQ